MIVPKLNEITAIESQYVRDGEPSLGVAYAMLKARWQAGSRDLETGLRLMFLAWYSLAEPTWLTGLPTDEDTRQVFREVFDHFGGTASDEPELLYAVALMSEVLPWCYGDEEEWSGIVSECRNAAISLRPEGYDPEYFEGRGTYGNYCAHQARSDPDGLLAGTAGGLGVLEHCSRIPLSSIRYVANANPDIVRSIQNGVLFLVAFWSSPCLSAFSRVTEALHDIGVNDSELVVVNVDRSPEIYQVPEFNELFGGVVNVPVGGGEAALCRDGKVVRSAIIGSGEDANEYYFNAKKLLLASRVSNR